MRPEISYSVEPPLATSPFPNHPDMLAVPYREEPVIISTLRNGDGARGMTDSAYFEVDGVPNWIGHKGVNLEITPPDNYVEMIGTNKSLSMFPDFYEQLLIERQVEYALFFGGHDISDVFGEAADVRKDSKYGFQPHRDIQNGYFIDAAEKLGLDIFGVCRPTGEYLLKNGARLSEAEPHHRPEDPNDDPLVHKVSSLWVPDTIYPELEPIETVNSHHHKQVKLRDLDQERLLNKGWYVYYVDSTHGVNDDSAVEILVRLRDDGSVNGVLFQSHPERFNSEDGLKMRKWMHSVIQNSHQRRLDLQKAA